MVSAALQLVSLQDVSGTWAKLEPVLGWMVSHFATSALICGGQRLPLAAASVRLHDFLSMQGGKVSNTTLSFSQLRAQSKSPDIHPVLC